MAYLFHKIVPFKERSKEKCNFRGILMFDVGDFFGKLLISAIPLDLSDGNKDRVKNNLVFFRAQV